MHKLQYFAPGIIPRLDFWMVSRTYATCCVTTIYWLCSYSVQNVTLYNCRWNKTRVTSVRIFYIVYRVPATGTRSPQIMYQQSLWMASTLKRLVIWQSDFLFFRN